jgi:hypothetical protein
MSLSLPIELINAHLTDSAEAKGFIALLKSDLPSFYKHFLVVRPEPVFIDIFKPTPYQTLGQFTDYFSLDKRPLWVLGKPESPQAYFGLHYFQREHDLANLDFVFFSGYPDPGSEEAQLLWDTVRQCLVDRGLTRLQSFVLASSIDKILLLESWGFHQEGILREHYFHNGEFHDVIVHAWIAEERSV